MNRQPRSGALVRFLLVGMLGFLLQVILLQFLNEFFRDYLLATVAAVELTILHNFTWHEWFTWKDRAQSGIRQRMRRLARFHLSNGMISIVGNIVLMFVFAGVLKLPLLSANLLSVGICGCVNFVVCDRWVFAELRAKNCGHASLPRSAIRTRVLSEKGT
jgi:putative flippase GtrA